MAYREQLEAAQAKIMALEAENLELKERLGESFSEAIMLIEPPGILAEQADMLAEQIEVRRKILDDKIKDRKNRRRAFRQNIKIIKKRYGKIHKALDTNEVLHLFRGLNIWSKGFIYKGYCGEYPIGTIMGRTWSSVITELVESKASPQEFMETVEKNIAKFFAEKK